MLNDWISAARARAAKRATSGQGFYLESEPLPKVLPGQGLGAGDDEVQELVADGPGDGVPPLPEGATWTRHPCEPTPEALAAWGDAWIEAGRRYAGSLLSPMLTPPAHVGGELRGPTPIADDLRADRERLLAANGTLARRVRTLESQLRAAGIEPAARE